MRSFFALPIALLVALSGCTGGIRYELSVDSIRAEDGPCNYFEESGGLCHHVNVTLYNPSKEEGAAISSTYAWKAKTSDGLILTATHSNGNIFSGGRLPAHDSEQLRLQFHTVNDAHLVSVKYESYTGNAKANMPAY